MITSLRAKGFKAWADTKPIRFAPLTVLFGTNSAGKSSIHQLLLAIKQTVESPDRKRVLHLGDKTSIVDLGTFRDIAHGHDESKPLALNIEWSLPEPFLFADTHKHGKDHWVSHMGFNVVLQQEKGRPTVEKFSYRLWDGDPQSEVAVSLTRKATGQKVGYDLTSTGFGFVRQTGRPWPLPPPVKCYGFPDETTAFYQNAGFTSDMTLEFEKLFRKIHYLGPLRQRPSRTYVWSGEVPEHVGYEGERTVEAVLSSRDRTIGKGPRARMEAFEKVIARWLSTLGLVESFEVRPIAKNRKEYEVLVKAGGGGESVSVTDVGFGVSQILPVIVQCFYVPAHSILILEQPEIHLHPQVQAGLADLVIEALSARENGVDRGLQIIVESHSEHFLRRLQTRIAQQAIKPDEVAAYFCRPGRESAVLESLDVDMFGNITNWPENFFGDEMADIAARTKAAMERGQREKP